MWGGQSYSTESTTESEQPTMVPAQHDGFHATNVNPAPRYPFIASSSDDLFHPTVNRPLNQPYFLPSPPVHHETPFNTAYIHPSDTFERISSFPPNFRDPPPHLQPPPIPHNTRPRVLPFETRHQAQFSFQPQPVPVAPVFYPSAHQPQYVYCVPPSVYPSPSSSQHFPKALPSVSHISLLNSKTDFYSWDEGVTSLLHHLGLLGHILDPAQPDRIPVPLPILHPGSSQAETAAYTRWWDDNNVAQHVLVSRLGSTPRGLLPSSNISSRTALSIYTTLTHYYGLRGWADGAELLNSLNASTCSPGRVHEYVSKWRTGVSRLRSANFPLSVKLILSNFVRGLPLMAAFHTLRAGLSERISLSDDQNLDAFISLTEAALDLDSTFRVAAAAQPPRATSSRAPPIGHAPAVAIPAITAPSSKPGSVSLPQPAERVNRSVLNCSNCNRSGHTVLTCFQPGGGMEGQRSEYRGNKGKVIAMFAEMIEEAFISSASPPPPELPDPGDTYVDELISPSAHLSIANSVAPNPDVHRDAYYLRDRKESPMAFVNTDVKDFESVAFISLGKCYNSALDSGCTDHIIRHRKLFQRFDTSKAVSIGTANSGSLAALGGGDVSFRVPCTDHLGKPRNVVFTLRGCLYAPDAPINLISIGALNENGLTVTFNPGASTDLSLPIDDPDLPGFTFHATVFRRLSLLNCDFIEPGDDRPAVFSAVTFPAVTPSPSLWHCRFGHIGQDATRAALTRDYVTGAAYKGSFVHEHCIACIIGKSPQHSYSHNGHRAANIGELLHMDLCGPYPVQGPRGEKHFHVILDDCSNFGFLLCLRNKSDACGHYLATEAFIERTADCWIKSVRVNGALELTAGKLGTHLATRGIAVQKTAPYAHSQAGKIERYVRTIEEGGQTLLAASGLPMSFWCDAVLSSQYLRNRLPTSTLAVNIMPYEVFRRSKPDVSHLRVWGCQCFVAIPGELREKAGFKRFEGIFVGYEENRKGWRVRDLKGKYHFSRDVIFNEDLSGRLGVPRSVSTSVNATPSKPDTRPTRERVRTIAGSHYDDILKLKDVRRQEREHRRKLADAGGGATTLASDGEAIVDGVAVVDDAAGDDVVHGGAALAFSVDLSPSEEAITSFSSFLASSSLPDSDLVKTESLAFSELDVLGNSCFLSLSS